ncbi:class E sortase [Glycomyces xiaoerkulensis]|uniref:class E sortase n=1 Tax=Glycomyces xiaoerkulensis TaxID=2038139 RepID=UPI0012FFE150|nr:class E sortase [Glycomyces xiaoerkulensis]
MSNQEWSPFAEESPPAPRPDRDPGRATPPPSAPRASASVSPPSTPQASSPKPSPYPHGSASAPGPGPARPSGAARPAADSAPAGAASGKASVPGGAPGSNPPHDQTMPLRPPSTGKQGAGGLIPEPDGTAVLPQIPSGEVPAPAGADSEVRKKRSVKRHRGDFAGGLRKGVRGAGEILISLGVIVLLYAAYEIFGVSAEINAAQDDLSGGLDVVWDQTEAESEEGVDGAPVPELGDAFARMWAPDIRAESWTLVEGTDLSDIEYAPGRYLDGAYPGEQGNFTLAGHNVPAIFQKIRDLEVGDKVVIETKESFYVYEVQEHVVVDETAVDITAPVPRNPGTPPGEDDYWLTLFTCHPLWDNFERYVVFGTLTDTHERDPQGDLPDEAIDPEA